MAAYNEKVLPFWSKMRKEPLADLIRDRIRYRLERELRQVQYDIRLVKVANASTAEVESELCDLVARETEIMRELEQVNAH